ncbi:MAG: tetratricopeptide repeat protein, partial [Paracoccaceae bacterium]
MLSKTANSRSFRLINLANVIKQLGEKEQALQLYKDVVEDQTRLLGPNHTDTLNTKANL